MMMMIKIKEKSVNKSDAQTLLHAFGPFKAQRIKSRPFVIISDENR